MGYAHHLVIIEIEDERVDDCSLILVNKSTCKFHTWGGFTFEYVTAPISVLHYGVIFLPYCVLYVIRNPWEYHSKAYDSNPGGWKLLDGGLMTNNQSAILL